MFKLDMLTLAVRTSLITASIGFSTLSFAAEEITEEQKNQAIELAQNTDDGLLEEVDLLEEAPERIQITGSRIRKAEFSEASPIQVIDGAVQREMGLFDTAGMLQSSTQASGLQIDNTFGGYVLDNGPGSATIGFRGLGAERTLVLINGRRIAPAGVGGAPVSADLNLIPGIMIDRVDNLLDGASTVYGSDAVAGVSNIILRQDFEGFDFEASYSEPKGGGAEELNLGAMWGKTTDRGYISVGVDYMDRKSQSVAENDFVKGCEERIFESQDGQIIKRYGDIGPTGNVDSCDIFPLTNRMIVPAFWGSLYYTPGFSNTGIDNWSETTVSNDFTGFFPSWVAADSNGDGINDITIVDGDGDGLRDVDFQNPLYAYQQSDYYRSGDYAAGQERYSFMVNGEYNFQDDTDSAVYFEALYSKRDTPLFTPGAQLFEWVGASNPYNPCGEYGIDCLGVLGFPVGAQEVRPIINIRGDRDRNEVNVEQYRLVTGLSGNLPFFENIGLNDWYYDTYVSYSASTGENSLVGINEQRLLNSLDAVQLEDGTVECRDTSDGCVAVNLFGENIYQPGGGTLTAAEAEYLMVERYMETKVNQFVFNGFVGGDLFKLPWNGNTVATILGIEYRRDEIDSNPNDVASEGLLWGYFADQGATGSRNLKEAFVEVDFPLLSGKQWAEELTMTASARVSKESFYDAATTYNVKGIYRPVDWFTIRGTRGTSYRAPNLRERFLSGTTGFNTVLDPCVVPTDARVADPTDPTAISTYDPSLDPRTEAQLAACTAAGVDPTSLGLGTDGSASFTDSYSAEISTGGSTELEEERSTATTYGFVFEQPFSEDFELTLSATHFDIDVRNSIAEPSAAYSIDQCYSADGNRAFCDRLQRNASGQIDFVDASFINIGQITSTGYDFNIYYNQEFVVASRNLDVKFDLSATKMEESLYDVLGTVDDNVGEPDVPEWKGAAMLSFEYNDFGFRWQSRFIGKGAEDDLGEFEEGTVACSGLSDANGNPLLCRPVAYTEDYWVHNAAFTYSYDEFNFSVGVRNLFNDAPPKVDPAGSFSNTNIPLGVGYENPRSAYLTVGATF